MKVRELIKTLVDLPMDYNVDISVKVGEHYHFAKEFTIAQFEGNRLGLYGIEEAPKGKSPLPVSCLIALNLPHMDG